MSFTPETLLRHWQTLCLIPRHPRKAIAEEVCDALAEAGLSASANEKVVAREPSLSVDLRLYWLHRMKCWIKSMLSGKRDVDL